MNCKPNLIICRISVEKLIYFQVFIGICQRAVSEIVWRLEYVVNACDNQAINDQVDVYSFTLPWHEIINFDFILEIRNNFLHFRKSKCKNVIAVIQRVSEAKVEIENKTTGQIETGLMVLLGIEHEDGEEDISWLSRKVVNLRVFDDENGVMNKSLIDVGGDILLVSQFTLHASTKKGNRPSYIKAARPEIAIPLYESFKSALEADLGKEIQAGEFGAMMQVSLCNDGPVTILIDTKDKK